MKKNNKSIASHSHESNNKATHVKPTKGSKHDANLRKNSFYHFQLGLLLAMLLVYGGLEASFAVKGKAISNTEREVDEVIEYYPDLDNYIIEKPKVKIKKAVKIVNPTAFKVVNDDVAIDIKKEFIDVPKEEATGAIDVDAIPEEAVSETIDVPFILIQDAPLFPGCERVVKEERKACFNRSMGKHIRKNMKYPVLEQERGIEGKVYVMFKIDVDGSITDLKLRGPAKGLEKEAARIIGKLPKMIPGKQRGVPVRVPFSIPIHFTLKK